MAQEGQVQGCGATFHAQLHSDSRDIRRCLGESRGFLARCGVAPGAAMQAELVLAEVLNNIAEHAYGAAGPGWIGLSLRLDKGDATVCIRDRGAPMPCEHPPAGALPDPSTLPEGGFGWFLIRRLSSGLDYCRKDGINRLSFSLPLRDPD